MKSKNKRYQKVPCRKRIREPKEFPGLLQIPIRVIYTKDHSKDNRTCRIQKSQPNNEKKIQKIYNRKNRHQKLKNKYELFRIEISS